MIPVAGCFIRITSLYISVFFFTADLHTHEADGKLTGLCCSSMDVLFFRSLFQSHDWKLRTEATIIFRTLCRDTSAKFAHLCFWLYCSAFSSKFSWMCFMQVIKESRHVDHWYLFTHPDTAFWAALFHFRVWTSWRFKQVSGSRGTFFFVLVSPSRTSLIWSFLSETTSASSGSSAETKRSNHSSDHDVYQIAHCSFIHSPVSSVQEYIAIPARTQGNKARNSTLTCFSVSVMDCWIPRDCYRDFYGEIVFSVVWLSPVYTLCFSILCEFLGWCPKCFAFCFCSIFWDFFNFF